MKWVGFLPKVSVLPLLMPGSASLLSSLLLRSSSSLHRGRRRIMLLPSIAPIFVLYNMVCQVQGFGLQTGCYYYLILLLPQLLGSPLLTTYVGCQFTASVAGSLSFLDVELGQGNGFWVYVLIPLQPPSIPSPSLTLSLSQRLDQGQGFGALGVR